MNAATLLTIAAAGIAVLLVLVIKVKLQPFVALVVVSLGVALAAGVPPADLVTTIQDGMGATLGYIATIIALGAMIGRIIELSGGARALAESLIERFGERRTPLALTVAGFILGIPVFFDVGLIITAVVIAAGYLIARRMTRREYPMAAEVREKVYGNGEPGLDSDGSPGGGTPVSGEDGTLLAPAQSGTRQAQRPPSFLMVLSLIGTPIVLMLLGAIGKNVLAENTVAHGFATVLGAPMIAFLIALLLRMAQGSATVALVAGAGLLAPLLSAVDLSAPQLALVTLAMGGGALAASHINDSGFWMFTKLVGLEVSDGLRAWTVLTTAMGVLGFALTAVVWQLV